MLIEDPDDLTPPVAKERLLVTDTSGGQTWKVMRGDGETTATRHTAGQKVTLTYMPLIPTSGPVPSVYTKGTPAHMCLQETGQYGIGGPGFFRYIDSGDDGWAANF